MRDFKFFLTLTLVAILAATSAQAATSGAQIFTDPNGAYTGTKSFTVYSSDEVANPMPGPAGSFTYAYTIMNDPGSFVALVGFQIEVAEGSVLVGDVGHIDTVGNPTPSTETLSTTSSVPGFDTVEYGWADPDLIVPGATSDVLYVISSHSPGTVNDNIFSINGDFGFDADSTCVGPLTPPSEDGDPNACTIGWWKNRFDEKQGTTQFFPDPDFQQVVDAAVILSGGLFTSGDPMGDCNALGFDDLLCALSSKGKRTIGERGRQQLAATYLNLAAGDLFPDNLKCALFEGNNINSNACGDAITVGDAVNQAAIDILDPLSEHDAHECSDDLNNGIGVTP